MKQKQLLLILLIIGTAFWGISYSVTKLAIGNYSPATFLFYRFLLAVIVLSIIFWKYVKDINLQAVKTGFILAVPMFLGIHLQTIGLKYTDASQCSFIAGLTVIIIPLMKLGLYKTNASLKIWIAAFTALTGLFVIAIQDKFTVNVGDLFTIAGSFGFAVYLIAVEKHSATKNLLYSIVPMFAFCALFTFCIALTDAKAVWLPQNDTFWLGVVYCALFSTAYMYTVSNISQRYLSAERVAVIYLFEPVFGAIGAFFILGEDLSWRLLLGGSLIFAGTIISEVNFKSPKLRILTKRS
ncbi:DMT family transporter [Flavobacterium quisquiliarum]|uniref:DMT family transporter n=1 Tax=Flavobacterium quisquiliarum TaxID=1834436 RepID=A0ABV8W3X6_9FLAO|nr:DMT family transporter [Flavobacterium quisquiliarum]MBW1653852.1 EamA family transporter [Flavobacterium quisquiliarum]NWL01559.1 EamA/RhaT family transporter [Flavobacterium collinsii]